MTMRTSRQEKIEKALVDLINKMFEIAGHAITYDDIKDRSDAWYCDWTMTEGQYKEWKKWGKKYLQDKLYFRAKQAEKEMTWFGLMYGLKFSDFGEQDPS
jgi:hypothetical protein